MNLTIYSSLLLIFLSIQVKLIFSSETGGGHSAHQEVPSIPGNKKHGEKCTVQSQECDKTLKLECKIDGKCRCGPGFSSSQNKTCLLSHGENCTGNIPCNSDRFLKCSTISSKCECKYPLEQDFDQNSTNCRSKVGSSHCNLTDTTWSQRCVKDAYCSAAVKDSHSKHECKCKHGFVESKSKLCISASAPAPAFEMTLISTAVYSFLILAINY